MTAEQKRGSSGAEAVLLLAGLAMIVSCSREGPAGIDPAPQHDFTPLTSLIQSTLDTLEFADSAALLLIQNGHVIYEGEFGALTLDTPIPIASAAKWLTAATVLAVVDAGALELNGRMDQYLPSNFYRGPGGAGKEAITIRQLLSLTAGLPSTHPCIYQDSKSLEECMLDIGARALVAPAGSAFVYGQAAFTVAGAAAEQATGSSWNQILQRELLDPLNLRNTHYLGDQNPQLGDGAISTVRDYSVFVSMIKHRGRYQDRQVLPAGLVDEMLRDQSHGATILFSPREASLRYGLGVWRDRVAGNGRPLVVSSPGSLGLVPWIDFERDLVGVLAVPPHLERTGSLAQQILELINQIVPVE